MLKRQRFRTLVFTMAVGLLAAACSDDDPADDLSTASSPAPTSSAGESSTTASSAPSSSSTPSSSTAPSTTAGPSTTTAVASTTTGAPTTTEAPPLTVAVSRLVLGLELVGEARSPVAFANRAGTADLYVAEQGGRVRRFEGGTGPASDDIVLDLQGRVSGASEQGLLGLVFSADGERMYVHYTDRSGSSVTARYDMAENVADVDTEEVLLVVAQPRNNHNGGHLAFGPDGFLYIGLGDGGGAGDPDRNGQNPDTLLGSILRIDVSPAQGYRIPSDNPFVAGNGAPEAFVWGVRNPWRFSFDSATGDLWVADVGQDRFEEVTVLRAADGAGNGANMGWNELEGFEPFGGGTAPPDHVAPIATYAIASGRCAVTGGSVYRGSEIPSLVGTYVFGDFCSGELFGVDADGEMVLLDIPTVDQLSSFGVDEAGELYALSRAGGIFRIVAG